MKLRFTPNAVADIDSVYDYIAADDPVAAQTVLLRIGQLVDQLPAHPMLGRKGRVDGTRELIVPNTPFIAVYEIEEPYLNILAIIHTSRRWAEHF
ncbi:MAG: type II toxin-antitoxin system RelE/ParE family toxin [Gammaproteobacteria bacterium]|nr:type II toxin-antitoxin system RelE/ParE family toxin [Gammaproteobacteria bacterium]MBU1724194.1 type II toxin-antitoxin system RelE/ParE family toxin [Gammaproteobacteria bacterium]MBU2005061.1 type II toxin-antitoxin system RelE/ParE family toxin [Gammaproteobacteria bacterium]